MANKGGLGRGLGALLGGTYEEEPSKPSAPPVAPKKSEPEEEEHEPTREIIESEETLVAEDNVTIKSVATREVRTNPQTKDAGVGHPASFGLGGTYAHGSSSKTSGAPGQQKQSAPSSSASDEKDLRPKATDEIDIDLIEPNPDQPRTTFKKEELEELAASIERDGLLQPILVRRVDKDKYQIIAGERRYQACKQIGLKKVPVRIKDATENKALELALIENIQRSDLNPIEEAYGYRRIMERQKLTQAELARMMSKGRSTIANALRLLELPEEAQQLLYEEKITAGHARAILSVDSKEGRQKLTEKLVKEKLSVRETENIARLLSNRPTPSSGKKAPTPASFKAVARGLSKKLETNVRVKTVKGKNKIEIVFKDESDLQRIFETMMNEAE